MKIETTQLETQINEALAKIAELTKEEITQLLASIGFLQSIHTNNALQVAGIFEQVKQKLIEKDTPSE